MIDRKTGKPVPTWVVITGTLSILWLAFDLLQAIS